MKRYTYLFIATMLFALHLPLGTIFAEQEPDNFGAKGALNDNTITVKEALNYAIEDEYIALSRYSAVISKYGYIRPFTHIQFAEKRHISSLFRLFNNLDISIPKDKTTNFVTEPESLRLAFESAIHAEKNNIAMYNKFLEQDNIPNPVREVFTNLRDASKNHLTAFQRGLKKHQ